LFIPTRKEQPSQSQGGHYYTFQIEARVLFDFHLILCVTRSPSLSRNLPASFNLTISRPFISFQRPCQHFTFWLVSTNSELRIQISLTPLQANVSNMSVKSSHQAKNQAFQCIFSLRFLTLLIPHPNLSRYFVLHNNPHLQTNILPPRFFE